MPDTRPPSSRPPLPTAPLWRRLAAMFYDSFLVLAIWMLVDFLLLWAFGIEEARTLEGEVIVLDPLFQTLLLAALLVSAFGFFALFWTKSGQTLGMQAWKIRVQRPDGSPIDLRQSLVRFASAPPSLLILGLGYLMMFADPARRTLPDRLSGSEVVELRSRAAQD